jgi:hypothetical protein
MTAALIDGKAIAADLGARVMAAVRGLADSHGIVPGLAVVLVGDDLASEVYIGAKNRMCAETGMRPIDHRLPASASQAELLVLIAQLNGDRDVTGQVAEVRLEKALDEVMDLAPRGIREHLGLNRPNLCAHQCLWPFRPPARTGRRFLLGAHRPRRRIAPDGEIILAGSMLMAMRFHPACRTLP